MTIDGEAYKFDQLHSKIRNFNNATHSYSYNVNVLIRLLETEYIQRELETQDVTLYPKFLTRLLTSPASDELKLTICRIVLKGDKQEEKTAEVNKYAVLVGPLMELYKTSLPKMATLACAALINVSLGNKETKQQLMNDGAAQIISQRLDSKDEPVLLNTLMLARNLSITGNYRRALTMYNVVEKLIGILVGTGIPDADYSPKIKLANTQLLSSFCQDPDAKEEVLKNEA